MHDLETVDLIRERMGVGYKEAKEALDQAEGDVVAALAILEDTTDHGLQALEDEAKEEVRRGLSGDQLSALRWKIFGQPIAEASVALIGVGAVAVGLLALLISSSTIETEYSSTESVSEDQAPESH